jgi:hypothetical protein
VSTTGNGARHRGVTLCAHVLPEAFRLLVGASLRRSCVLAPGSYGNCRLEQLLVPLFEAPLWHSAGTPGFSLGAAGLRSGCSSCWYRRQLHKDIEVVRKSLNPFGYSTCQKALGVAQVMSTTDDSLQATQVLAEPLLTSRSPRPAAQLDNIFPRVSVPGLSHSEEWALKSPKTSTWRGWYLLTQSPTPFREFPNAARPLLGET